jgi:Holliday junction DNA helicase RuvA
MNSGLNQELELYIYQSISENSNTLFGFKTIDELELFEKLITVSGIGPRIALNILESPTEIIKHAIINRDIALLVEFPGIGKKTAERLCLELQTKLKLNNINSLNSQSQNIEDKDYEKKQRHSTPLCNEEAFEALQTLGFSRLEAHRLISKVASNIFKTEDIVKEALKNKS